ncbi:ABC transporter substrate-binding protein [Uliginosibacterium sp. sgz301328]|uniref:ABC transporter substrate-binding protein n=1 Tax=Uliginosibacterium sp. sgz301328 TaxID=3243764 RepID=UPI00359DDC71
MSFAITSVAQRRMLVALGAALVPMLASAYQEAPELAALVKEGKLEPVDKRLPAQPQVIKPLTRVGTYGGKLRTAMRADGDYNAILRMVGNQGLTRWTMDFNNVEPNLAESWTLSPDGTTYTFKLRPGTKWSDGSPFTADDILFSMNDLIGNKEFLAAPLSTYVVKDKYVETTKIDDYTVRFKFAGPYLGFIEQLALPTNQHPTFYQKKYCSQFHPKYNPKIADELARNSVKDWGTLMRAKCGDIELASRWSNPERPTLDPWVVKEPYTGTATRVLLERNPYFWQVDTAGNQLPYIDTMQLQINSAVEGILLSSINGELDFQHRHIYLIQNRPILLKNAEKGGYKVLGLPPLSANSVGMFFNYTTKNEDLRKLIRNHDFRQALSLATDREEINKIVYLGQGTPWQIGPIKESKWFNEQLGTQFTKYDIKQANALLDKLGLTKRDGNGYRLYPDGKRVSLNVIIAVQLAQQVQALEIVRKQWARAGIELVILASDRSLFYNRANANDYDISADQLAGGLDITLNPRGVVAVHPQESRQSLLWVKWYLSGGKQGEEPTASMKKRLDLYTQWQTASSQAEADRLFKAILQEAANEFEVMGLVRPPKDPAIRKNNLTNVFENMPAGWSYPTPGPSLPQQWFYAK